MSWNGLVLADYDVGCDTWLTLIWLVCLFTMHNEQRFDHSRVCNVQRLPVSSSARLVVNRIRFAERTPSLLSLFLALHAFSRLLISFDSQAFFLVRSSLRPFRTASSLLLLCSFSYILQLISGFPKTFILFWTDTLLLFLFLYTPTNSSPHACSPVCSLLAVIQKKICALCVFVTLVFWWFEVWLYSCG
jgi:hypothetical protein